MTIKKEKKEGLGSYLKSLRLARDLTLREVEKMSEISSAFLSQIESGKVKKPSPIMLYKLAHTFGVSYEYLMESAGHPTSSPEKFNTSQQEVFHRLGPITEEEENSLVEYLSFLRSKTGRER